MCSDEFAKALRRLERVTEHSDPELSGAVRRRRAHGGGHAGQRVLCATCDGGVVRQRAGHLATQRLHDLRQRSLEQREPVFEAQTNQLEIERETARREAGTHAPRMARGQPRQIFRRLAPMPEREQQRARRGPQRARLAEQEAGDEQGVRQVGAEAAVMLAGHQPVEADPLRKLRLGAQLLEGCIGRQLLRIHPQRDRTRSQRQVSHGANHVATLTRATHRSLRPR